MGESFGNSFTLVEVTSDDASHPTKQMWIAPAKPTQAMTLVLAQVPEGWTAGQFLCAREAVREFARRGVAHEVSAAAGKLVFMSSVHQEIPWAGHVNYAASKGGVMQLMRSIAQEVAPLAIRANAVAPGAIRTPINRPAWETPEAYRALMTLVPYKRIGEPDDIAHAVAWLASDAADYVTGGDFVRGWRDDVVSRFHHWGRQREPCRHAGGRVHEGGSRGSNSRPNEEAWIE
jgi:NAD(P)-dependent dehydrogenase (short-subunit alcohol dehydrogenase family)